MALALSLLAGCTRGRPAQLPSAGPPSPVWVSAPASARMVVHLVPRELFEHPSTEPLWEAFVDPARETEFVERTGIDPRRLFELTFVELQAPAGAFMLVLRGPFDADAAVQDAGERLAFVEVSQDRPRLRREGLRGEGRWAYVALAPDTLLVARDAPPTALAELMARLAGAPSELPPEARALAESHADRSLAVLVPSPLELPGGSGAALLLARERALVFALSPQREAFQLSLDLRGEFPASAEANFRALIESIATTQLGEDLGLAAALDSLTVRHDPETGRVVLGLRVPAEKLVAGLRLLFSEELTSLFE